MANKAVNIPRFIKEECMMEVYLEIIENIFEAGELREELQPRLLLGHIGFDVYSKLRSLTCHGRALFGRDLLRQIPIV